MNLSPYFVAILPTLTRCRPHRACCTAEYSTSTVCAKAVNPKNVLPPRPKVPEEDTYKKYLKGSGPGGQKINKTSSAVQLTHLPTGLVVKSQATRSRTQNESIARRLLAEKVEQIEKGSESRVERKRERDSRKKRSAEKKSRRKYRSLAAEKEGQSPQNAHDTEDTGVDFDGESMSTSTEESDRTHNKP